MYNRIHAAAGPPDRVANAYFRSTYTCISLYKSREDFLGTITDLRLFPLKHANC